MTAPGERRGSRRGVRDRAFVALVPALSALVLASGVPAQAPDSTNAVVDSSASGIGRLPRVGLALSGGSAKGLAHVGVLRVLEREGVPVHGVAGTSMGSIVGGLYALGVGVDSLEVLARSLDWDALFTDRVERSRLSPDQRAFDERQVISLPFADGRVRLPSGAVEGSAIQRLLARLTWPAATVRDFARLPRAFVAVATDLETGEAVPLRRGVLADAMRASLAIPGAIEPFLSNGRLLVDGGLARNLPADDARALGTDLVICSDVSDPLERAEELVSFVDVLMQSASFRGYASTVEQRERCDLLIQPDIDDLSPLDFASADEWLRRGEAAAERAIAQLREAAARAEPWPAGAQGEQGAAAAAGAVGTAEPEGAGAARAAGSVAPAFAGRLPDSIAVSGLELVGVRPSAAAFVTRTVDLERRPTVSAIRLDAVLEDLAASGLVGPVRYEISPDSAGALPTLVVHADPRARDEVGLGVRYDDLQRAALLFSATLYDLVQFGSATRLDARLGEELQFRGTYLSGRSVTGSFSLGAEVGWSQSPLDLFEGKQRVARAELEVASAAVLVGLAARRGSLLAVEFRGERAVGSTSVAVSDSTVSVLLASTAISFLRETYDRAEFPRAGGRIVFRSEFGVSTEADGGGFSHHVLDVDRRLPLHSRVSAFVGVHIGHATGRDLPQHRRFFAGGDHRSPIFRNTHPTFAGQQRQSLSGTSLDIVRAGLQVEVARDRFLTVGLDAGNASDDRPIDPDDYRFGWSLSAGSTSIVGPLWITLTGGDGDLQWSFNVGRRF